MVRRLASPARAALIAVAMALFPALAHAEAMTFECSGDVIGKFTFDPTGGTGAMYDENRWIPLKDVEISSDTIIFTQEHSNDVRNEVPTGQSSLFRIDRSSNKITEETYDYIDHKVSESSRSTGQCKMVPNPGQSS